MNKTMAAWVFWSGAGVCLIVSGLYLAGLISFPLYAAFLILTFPVIVLALFFWWMAGQSGGDIPFIGY